MGQGNCIFLHVTPLLYVKAPANINQTHPALGEGAAGNGVSPDLVVLRTDGPLDESVREKSLSSVT